MSVIYQPKGKAREYSPLACNVYLQCSHNCKYCYAPQTMKRLAEQYFVAKPKPRNNIVEQVKKELIKTKITEQVLLSFIGDCYCETADNGEAVREILKLFLEKKVPTAILTKGGKRLLKDIDLIEQFGEHIQIGATLTFFDEAKSLEWESGAAIPAERLEVLKLVHDKGIKTFASFEPVIDPNESIKLIEQTLKDNSVDIYKIGKLNNYKGLDKKIDWADFLKRCLKLLRPTGKGIYIKYDLRQAASNVKLLESEMSPDEHNPKKKEQDK